VDRLVDANLNRAREAMRVMEDAARFLLDDRPLAADLKQLRHDLAAALPAGNDPALWRDTPGDVGTDVSVPAEMDRSSLHAVATAAAKRLTEALRCLEEYGKLSMPAPFAQTIESLRYRAYDLEQRLLARLGSGRRQQWRLCVILTESLCSKRTWEQVAAASLAGGADCLQLREKDLADGPLLERAQRLVEIRGRARASVIINDRPDIALLSGADGVHLGAGDLPVESARQLGGGQLLVGASTHDLNEAKRAVSAGCDYCGVGTIFPTTTKRRPASGAAYLQAFLEAFPRVPHLAIGGINRQTAADVVRAGARGLAVSSAVCAAENPEIVVRDLLNAMESDS